jgi:protein gp37
MAETTAISWTTSTFNPWIGCTRVSPGCDHCYAEARAARFRMRDPGGNALWTPGAARHRTKTWKEPHQWNAEAVRLNIEWRVFCASLADVFDNQVPEEWRADLWDLIGETPALTWQLLTKRPQNIRRMLPPDWGHGWAHVWLGTTVENMTEAHRRIPELLAVPATVHWLSCEPLLEPLNLRPWLGRIAWVICGGESGSTAARPMRPHWARTLRDQCHDAGTAFWFKQTGNNRAEWPGVRRKGAMAAEWPADLQIQQLPV